MSIYKRYRPFIESIEPYGLYTEKARKHMKIMKDGKIVASMSVTPTDIKVAIDHTLRYLILAGHLPKINRNNYVYELRESRR